MKKNKKLLALVCCMALLVGAVGATLAWLTDSTTEITNTFTAGNINISLDEVKVDEYGNVQLDQNNNPIRIPKDNDVTNTYKMVPGNEYVKDPTVTVTAKSEDCYVFIKVEKTSNYDTFIISPLDSKWKPLGDSYLGIYYLENVVEFSDSDQKFSILTDNKITVNPDVTKTQLNGLTDNTLPNIKFTAYAVQKANMTSVQDAWENSGFGL